MVSGKAALNGKDRAVPWIDGPSRQGQGAGTGVLCPRGLVVASPGREEAGQPSTIRTAISEGWRGRKAIFLYKAILNFLLKVLLCVSPPHL